jgi:hypothetical protein
MFFHRVGVETKTEINDTKLILQKNRRKLSQMQIMPTLFHYSNSFSLDTIIPKHPNVECIVPSGIPMVA